MTVKEYQEYVRKGASEKYQDTKFAALALVGEVGEVCDVVKKSEIYSNLTIDFRNKLIDEMGDVLWQYVALMNSIETNFDEIINFNVEKLNKRHGGPKLDITGGKR